MNVTQDVIIFKNETHVMFHDTPMWRQSLAVLTVLSSYVGERGHDPMSLYETYS
jgi:hypothetical protein